MVPLGYDSGISQPPKGTILAPRARWAASSGEWRSVGVRVDAAGIDVARRALTSLSGQTTDQPVRAGISHPGSWRWRTTAGSGGPREPPAVPTLRRRWRRAGRVGTASRGRRAPRPSVAQAEIGDGRRQLGHHPAEGHDVEHGLAALEQVDDLLARVGQHRARSSITRLAVARSSPAERRQSMALPGGLQRHAGVEEALDHLELHQVGVGVPALGSAAPGLADRRDEAGRCGPSSRAAGR